MTPITKPVLLDLFCGAGGAARGYQRAGFYVIGVDHKPQPRYAGDEFIQDDATITSRPTVGASTPSTPARRARYTPSQIISLT